MIDKRGGARPGAGRPKLEVTRGFHQMRAFPDEWEIVKRFANILKHGDRAACEAFLAKMETKTE
ncbi:MAG: hypothetical protein IJ849_02000 [Selenomonadaceae bacterium]|nr:hypothetical protein [Selenomonadaceae bacterium]